MVNFRLDLPDITVVLVDGVAHKLSEMALERTLNLIEPRALIIVSNKYMNHRSIRSFCYMPDKLESIGAVESAMWYKVTPMLFTSHVLFIQYDGFVLNPELWDREWLNYDYIGAPWPWHDSNRVGNGGFSLRSKRLMEFLYKNREMYPVKTPEDDTLCRTYRSELETDFNFRWAPEVAAERFSFERGDFSKTFGFHGIYNIPRVLPPPELYDWTAAASDYVRAKPEWREMASVVMEVSR